MECTELFKFSSRSAQEKVRIAQNMVAAISEGRKPDVRAMGDDEFVASAVSACLWFVEHQVNSTDPPLYGKSALAKKLETPEKKKRASTKYELHRATAVACRLLVAHRTGERDCR